LASESIGVYIGFMSGRRDGSRGGSSGRTGVIIRFGCHHLKSQYRLQARGMSVNMKA